MTDGAVVVCSTVAPSDREVVPGSVRRHCSTCQRPVWVSPSSMPLLMGGAAIQCMGCVFAETGGRDIRPMPLSPLQIRELEEHFRR